METLYDGQLCVIKTFLLTAIQIVPDFATTPFQLSSAIRANIFVDSTFFSLNMTRLNDFFLPQVLPVHVFDFVIGMTIMSIIRNKEGSAVEKLGCIREYKE